MDRKPAIHKVFIMISIFCFLLVGNFLDTRKVMSQSSLRDTPEDSKLYQAFVQSWKSSRFLDHAHHKARVDCRDCHRVKRPHFGSEVPSEQCISCHEMESIIEKTEESGFNPHDAPHFGEECTKCHHAHKKSKMSCSSDKCHTGYRMNYSR